MRKIIETTSCFRSILGMLKPYTIARIMELHSIPQTKSLRLSKNQNDETLSLELPSTSHLRCLSELILVHLQTCGRWEWFFTKWHVELPLSRQATISKCSIRSAHVISHSQTLFKTKTLSHWSIPYCSLIRKNDLEWRVMVNWNLTHSLKAPTAAMHGVFCQEKDHW